MALGRFNRRRPGAPRPGAPRSPYSPYGRRRDRRIMQKTVSSQEAEGAPPRGAQARATPPHGSPARATPAQGTPARATPAQGQRALSPAEFAEAVDGASMTPTSIPAIADSSATMLAQVTEDQIDELRRDINAARELQLRMLPSRPPRIPGYECTAFYDACDMLAGDFFQFVEATPNHTGFLVADVSGHGLTAAMLMASCFKTFSIHAREKTSPREVLDKVYRELAPDLPQGRFITAFYAVLNHASGEVKYARAGHNPAFLYQASRKEVLELKQGGLALGLGNPDLFLQRMEEGVTHLLPGSTLLIYSDGITEAHNTSGEQFGEQRLLSTFQQVAHLRSRPMVERLIEDMRAHTQTDINEDDLTLVILKRD